MMAVDGQVISGHPNNGAFQGSSNSAAGPDRRGKSAGDAAPSPVDRIERYPGRVRALIIVGGAALSWAAVLGVLALIAR